MDQLQQLLIEYLKLGSCDGKKERQQLRKQLCNSLGYEYDTKSHSIITTSSNIVDKQ